MDLKQLRKKHPFVPIHLLKKALKGDVSPDLSCDDKLLDILLKESRKVKKDNADYFVYGIFENDTSITIVKFCVGAEWLTHNKLMHDVANELARYCYLIDIEKKNLVVERNLILAYWTVVFNQDIKIVSVESIGRNENEILGICNIGNRFVYIAKLEISNSSLNDKCEPQEIANIFAKNAGMYYGDYFDTYSIVDKNQKQLTKIIHPISPKFHYYLLTRTFIDFDKQFEIQINVNNYFYLVQNTLRKIDGCSKLNLRIRDILCFVDSRYFYD
jgi:hypothetical protein